MAEIVIFESGNTFILKMSDEDMEQLTELCTEKRHNYFDTVIACFHLGLVTMTQHAKCCLKYPNNRKRCQNLLPQQKTDPKNAYD